MSDEIQAEEMAQELQARAARRPRIQVACALVVQDHRVLLLQRSFAKDLGGLWEMPGGKVEPGELPHFTAQRELREETDLYAVPYSAAFDVAGDFDPPVVAEPCHYMLFVLQLVSDRKVILEPECPAYGWFGGPSLRDLGRRGLLAPGIHRYIGIVLREMAHGR